MFRGSGTMLCVAICTSYRCNHICRISVLNSRLFNRRSCRNFWVYIFLRASGGSSRRWLGLARKFLCSEFLKLQHR